jgi:hypothetical protein
VLTIDGNQIVDVYGRKVDAAGTGTLGSTKTISLFRFFGDAIVDATDYIIFREAYLSDHTGGASSAFDYNGDGLFALIDAQAFTDNFRRRTLD